MKVLFYECDDCEFMIIIHTESTPNKVFCCNCEFDMELQPEFDSDVIE